MSTDLFKQVLFNDGEETTFGDLNDQENFADAMLTDQILESLSGDFTLTGTDPTFQGKTQANIANHLAYCLKGGSAYLRLGSANNKLQIAPGVLFQKVANKDGNASTFLPYYFDGSSTYEFTIAAGPGANYRIDLCQMSLTMASGNSQVRDFKDATTGAITSQTMNKKRQVNCALSVKQGTVSATPTVPDPDAGCVALGFVVVGPAYVITTALDFANYVGGATASVYDVRMPMNIRTVDVVMQAGFGNTAWATTAGSNGPQLQSSNAINVANIPVGPGDSCSRLVGFFMKKDAAAWTSGGTFINCSNASLNIPQVNSTNQTLLVPYYTLDAQAQVTSPATITPSTVNKIGPAVWSGYGRCAVPRVNADTNLRYPYLHIQSGNNGSQILALTCYWAG